MSLSTMENIYEKKRTAFIAALIRGDLETANTMLADVSTRLQTLPRLSEIDQKAINQLLVAAKKLGEKHPQGAGKLLRQARASVKTALAQVVRAQVKSVEIVAYDAWRRKLAIDDDRYRVMLQNVASCQLSVGCSNFCRRCNEWALAGVRKHFAFEAARRIVRDLHDSGNDRYALYCASDPLDYRCGDRTIADLLRYMRRQGYRTQFGLLTKVPRGSEALAAQFLEADVDIAVSLTEKNRARVSRIERRAGKRFKTHHDTAELLIPAGLDDDFTTVKSSITDNYGIEITPEGASMVIPTFTSALNPTGQCRLPITAASDWFIEKKVGRDALPVEYFKPLTVIRPDGTGYVMDHLLEAQVENILLDHGNQGPTPPGMMDLAEYFKTFDPDIVRQRERLAPVAIANLRRQVFSTATRKGRDRGGADAVLERKKQAYLDFCDLEKVAGFKQKAFGYLLAAVADYLQSHPAQRDVIRYLRGEEVSTWNARFEKTPLEILLADPGVNAFDSFSCLLSRLLAKPADDELAAFFSANPAVYDPDSGRFV